MATSYLDKLGLNYFWTKVNAAINGRLKFYAATKAQWDASYDFVSEQNVVYIYTDYRTVVDNNETIVIPGVKIGDGTTPLIDLSFIAANDEQLLNHINNQIIHVTAADRSFWNDKITCYIDPNDNENLVLSKLSE